MSSTIDNTDLMEKVLNRELLKGHFSLVAKRHGIKVSELKKAYNELINRREQ